MEFFVNILTLTACFATMAYCYVLAKRIHSFRNMKDGMGALIEEMIRTTSDLQIAFVSTQKNIDNEYHKLQDKIDEAISLNEYLSDIMNNIQTQTAQIKSIHAEILASKQGQTNVLSQVKKYSQAPVKQSTLPDSFKLSSLENRPEFSNNDIDPLDDVMPADFNSLRRKKRPQIIIPGEEYL
jgi:hypothetical protein